LSGSHCPASKGPDDRHPICRTPVALVREPNLAEINSIARHYRHAKTGTELLSLINTDENKVFGVSLHGARQERT
jgi:Zn-dependent M16 (insulinase) family peptidase